MKLIKNKQQDFLSPLTILKTNKSLQIILFIIFWNINVTSQSTVIPNKITKLETAISNLPAIKMGSSPEKGEVLSVINRLELEIDSRKQLISLLNLQRDQVSASIPIVDDVSLKRNAVNNLYNIILNKLYLSKISTHSTKKKYNSDYSLNSIYLSQLTHAINKSEALGEKIISDKAVNSDSTFLNISNRISNEKNILAQRESQMAKWMKSLKADIWNKNKIAVAKANTIKPSEEKTEIPAKLNIDKTVIEKPVVKTEDKPKNSKSLVNYVKNMSSSIATIQKENNYYQHNYELDNKLFEDTKGFMDWPMINAKLINRYDDYVNSSSGRLRQKGLVIQSTDPYVQCLAQGKVVKIISHNNNDKTIILVHDNGYYSIYTNIEEPFVNKDQLVKKSQSIGKAKIEVNNNYLIQLQIWKNNQNLNPSRWLKNK